MMKYILAGILGLSLLGAGVLWITNMAVQAERAKVLERATELVVERDKIDAKLKTATPGDVCRALGGRWLPDENECG
jgi:hypothetical protein